MAMKLQYLPSGTYKIPINTIIQQILSTYFSDFYYIRLT